MYQPRPFGKMVRCACLALALVGCEKPSTPKGRAGTSNKDFVAVEKADDAIVDADYCFRIDSMGTQWKMLPEKEVVRILPDAVAGALSADGTYGVVIIEPLLDAELSSYTELLQDSYSTPEGVVSPLREITFLGKPAVRFSQSMNVNGLAVDFEKLVFLHQGFGYQLIVWGPKGRFSKSSAEVFFDAFHLTDGTVKARSNVPPVADFDGVGRRVVDGRFESSIYRFAIEPPEGWQLAVGASLMEMNTAAEIGLTNGVLGAYVVVVPENIADLDPEAHTKTVSKEIADGMEADGGRILEPLNMTVGQDSIPFQRFVLNIGVPFRYYVGVYCANKCSYRILAWHQDQENSEASEAIASAIKSIRFLDQKSAAKLASELQAQPDPQNTIGPGYCLRNGVYRDFRHSVTWTKPPGFWRVTLGDEARAQNIDCRLLAEEAESGFYAQWIVEEAGDFDATTFHKLAVELTFGEEHPVVSKAPETLELPGASVLVSEAEVIVDGLTLAYRLGTTIIDNRAHQLCTWGRPENVRQSPEKFEAAMSGFAFPGKSLVESVNKLPTYRDNRAGFSVRVPGSGWTVQVNPQPQIEPLGTFLQFQRHTQVVQVMGLSMMQPGQDIGWAEDTVTNMLAANYSKVISATPTSKKAFFAGIPWKTKTWRDTRMSIHLATGVRQRTVYAIIVIAEGGAGNVVMRRVTKRFQLLD